MPALGFMLISVGCIDDAGYWSTFGRGICQIKTSDGMLIGNILKSGGVYTDHMSQLQQSESNK